MPDKNYEHEALLTDNNKYPIARMVYSIGEAHIEGTCYEPISFGMNNEIIEEQFFAEFSVKWDGCSHIYFYGQDYSDDDHVADSYYHICGAIDYLRHIKTMQFFLEVAEKSLGDRFNGLEKKQLEDMRKLGLLKDCSIQYAK